MMGYFRDDIPLCELILDDAGKREIDELWTELDFITEAPQRQHTGYIWYERAESATIRRWGPEFDEFRSEDKDITSEARLEKFSKMYLAKARESYAANGGDAIALDVLDDFFKSVNKKVRWLEGAKLASEPSHLKTLLDFADRAYRRPLSQAERDNLVEFYHQLRETDGLSHEDAIRDTLASVLISPNFCYRIDLSEPSPSGRGQGEGAGIIAMIKHSILTPTLSQRERESDRSRPFRLRTGQPAQLFPLVEHAGR